MSITPTNFTLPLVDYKFNISDELNFTLPATQCADGFAVRTSLTAGPNRLSFDPKTLKFTVKADSTKTTEAGVYTV